MTRQQTNPPQSNGLANGLAIGLVADIGGTNARFAAIDQVTGELVSQVRLDTQACDDGTQLVSAAVSALGCSPRACVLALAGPVTGPQAALTNADLTFDQADLEKRLDCRVVLVNDFVAMSRAVPAIQPVNQAETSVVMGPGTGLGVGFLVPSVTGLQVCPSEAGNAGFAPSDELEQELLAVLRPTFPVLVWESFLSGPGLLTLYTGMCELWGVTPILERPEEVSARGLDLSDPLCHKCLDVFFAMLGSAAGSLALTLAARGGVFLVGDLLVGMADFFHASQFRTRFEAQGIADKPAAAMLKRIPTELVMETDLGLTGVIHYARDRWRDTR